MEPTANDIIESALARRYGPEGLAEAKRAMAKAQQEAEAGQHGLTNCLNKLIADENNRDQAT